MKKGGGPGGGRWEGPRGEGRVYLGVRGVKLHQEADLVGTGLGLEQDSGYSGCCKDEG